MMYHRGNLVVLVLNHRQMAFVVENQQKDEHVKIWRVGQPAPEWLRIEDIMPAALAIEPVGASQ